MTACEKCGVDPAGKWLGTREQICGASPAHARQPMWACRFGVGPFDAYHASHGHDHDLTCLVAPEKGAEE